MDGFSCGYKQVLQFYFTVKDNTGEKIHTAALPKKFSVCITLLEQFLGN